LHGCSVATLKTSCRDYVQSPLNNLDTIELLTSNANNLITNHTNFVETHPSLLVVVFFFVSFKLKKNDSWRSLCPLIVDSGGPLSRKRIC
jgi:hypothetical protein